MKKVLFCMALVGLCASLAVADKPAPQSMGNAQRVEPLSYQRIGTDMKPIGPVYQYQGGIAQGNLGTLFFDNFEMNATNGPTDGRYGVDCAMGGSRWYFGSGYKNADYVNDMTLATGAGQLSFSQEWAWYWEMTEDCYTVIFPTEDFDDQCYGPPFATAYDGIAWYFGVLPPGGGYYYSAPTASFGIQMPTDGVGGYYTIFANAVTGSGIFLATMAQPMLWGTKDPSNPYFPGTSPSYQGTIQWDDDSPADGTFTVNECYAYDWGTGYCPGVTGGMMAFFGAAGTRCDANCDTYFDGADIDPFFLLLGDPDTWKTIYSCDAIIAGDANCDGYVDGADIDPFFLGLEVGACNCP